MKDKIKEMSLEERIEKLFESGWVSEFNYLENQLQEARCLVSMLNEERKKNLDYITNLQEENKKLNNIINKLEKAIKIKVIRATNEEDYDIELDDMKELLQYLLELKENI